VPKLRRLQGVPGETQVIEKAGADTVGESCKEAGGGGPGCRDVDTLLVLKHEDSVKIRLRITSLGHGITMEVY